MNRWISFFKRSFPKSSLHKSIEEATGMVKLDGTFQSLVDEKKVPGLSVTLFKNGVQLLQKGYGMASLEDKKPIEPKTTLFRVASISKCITGLALGKMVEEGLMSWDDSLYDHVPYYPKKSFDMTLRQLASHTAGIRGYQGKEFALNQPWGIQDSIAIFKDDHLVFEPGQGYLYNSFDFVLLSLAIQEASGMPFEDYVRENVLLPLEMRNTFAPQAVSASVLGERGISTSDFYTKAGLSFKKAIAVNNQYKLGGGGYLSTSADVAGMGQAILEGKLLKSETYKQLLTPQKVKGGSVYYGLGFQVSQDRKGRDFIGHVGNSVGAYTNFFVYPKEKWVVSILINCTDPKVQEDLDYAIQVLLPTLS